jgi:hypothetical protein
MSGRSVTVTTAAARPSDRINTPRILKVALPASLLLDGAISGPEPFQRQQRPVLCATGHASCIAMTESRAMVWEHRWSV